MFIDDYNCNYYCLCFQVVQSCILSVSLSRKSSSVLCKSLFLFASMHGTCVYEWSQVSKPDADHYDTAVLYCKKPGMYQCKISTSDFKEVIVSDIISVRVSPG